MAETHPDPQWQIKLLKPRLPWGAQAIRPAEVSDGLCGVMLARENLLEDVHYNKVVPNRFVVELSPRNYQRNYRPIEADVIQQWREKLLDHLATANSRQGRKEYRFGGQLQIEMRPAPDLKDSQARVLSQVQPQLAAPAQEKLPTGYLEMVPGGQRWPVYEGINTIGRDGACDIHLDMPVVHEKRLVSGRHAFIFCEGRQCTLYDGSPNGKPSSNGTFLNDQPVLAQGKSLRDGDKILLAALDPRRPRAETPGIVLLIFKPSGEV